MWVAQRAAKWRKWGGGPSRAFLLAAACCAAAGLGGCGKGSDSGVPDAPNAPDVAAGAAPAEPVAEPPRVQGLGEGTACASESVGLEQQRVALYVLLDTSASMQSLTRGDVTRWEAIQSAALAFVADSRDTRLNLGLQFFPQPKAGTRFTCRSNQDCGEGGLCATKTCTGGDQVVPCNTDQDCGRADRCVAFGRCELDDRSACVLGGGGCGTAGACLDFQPRSCVDVLDCSPERYANPAIPIGPISEQADAVTVQLAGRQLAGVTPTAPALTGALEHARSWAETHPDERVVVLLATDGLPTPCSGPNGGDEVLLEQALAETEQAAAGALAAATSIPTYVIGVFGDDRTAANLDRLAAAGGTSRARIVDATGNVQEQFLTALQEVRAAALRCDFALPAPNGPVNYRSASVSLQGGQSPGELAYVGSAAGCDSGTGWYYDADPEGPQAPRSVSLCPLSCEQVRQGAASSVSLQLGCATILR